MCFCVPGDIHHFDGGSSLLGPSFGFRAHTSTRSLRFHKYFQSNAFICFYMFLFFLSSLLSSLCMLGDCHGSDDGSSRLGIFPGFRAHTSTQSFLFLFFSYVCIY